MKIFQKTMKILKSHQNYSKKKEKNDEKIPQKWFITY